MNNLEAHSGDWYENFQTYHIHYMGIILVILLSITKMIKKNQDTDPI